MANGGSAAVTGMRRRRTAGGGAAGGVAGNMLQLYSNDTPGLKLSPHVVLGMSIVFIASVAALHVFGKLFLQGRS